MQDFEISDQVLEAYPEAEIRLVAAFGVDNTQAWPDVEDRIGKLESELAQGNWTPLGENDPAVATWHDAYRKFGTNPRRMRPSLDALGRRVAKSGTVPRISSAVDAYNYTSLYFGTPAGAFDASRLQGKVSIRFAVEGDRFTPLGQPGAEEAPKPGEVVYSDELRILTRHWNHRDCDETKVTEESRNVIFILERVAASAVPDSRMVDAQDELTTLLAGHAPDVFTATLGASSPVAQLPDSDT